MTHSFVFLLFELSLFLGVAVVDDIQGLVILAAVVALKTTAITPLILAKRLGHPHHRGHAH